MPFPQRDGVYDGQPADDDAAIRELERLRMAGAAFVAVAWPAMWWLEYFPRFHQHLRSKFCCKFHSERVVVFDLRTSRGG
jgi:hypothetical protein